MVTVVALVTGMQPPLLVDVSVKVTVPAVASVALGR